MVVGLGNPGAQFERTRHNVGAEAVSILVERHGEKLRPERGVHARTALASLGAEGLSGDRGAGGPPDPSGRASKVLLAVPTTYMNDSGLAVAALARRYKVASAGRIVVVHDELDLPPGRVRVKLGGGTAGHNGLKSIHSHLHDPSYVRVRIGIGKPPRPDAGVSYVLHRPGKDERALLEVALHEAADAVEEIVSAGVAAAMNRFNQG